MAEQDTRQPLLVIQIRPLEPNPGEPMNISESDTYQVFATPGPRFRNVFKVKMAVDEHNIPILGHTGEVAEQQADRPDDFMREALRCLRRDPAQAIQLAYTAGIFMAMEEMIRATVNAAMQADMDAVLLQERDDATNQ